MRLKKDWEFNEKVLSMTKRRYWFSRQKLNIKFTLVIGILVLVPVSCILALLFHNIRKNEISQSLSSLKYNMNQSYSVVQKTVDLCNMSTQVFLNFNNLNDFLVDLKEETPIETKELVAFYKEDIGMLERLVNSNPYLYQIRVYANNNTFSEMMPILYRRERMEQLSWAQGYSTGNWEFDYEDTLFQQTVNKSEHTMALITAIDDYQRGEIGVIEVAVRMDTIFPEVFQTTNQEWACFVDRQGRVYTKSKSGEEVKWDYLQEDILSQLQITGEEKEYYSTLLAGEQVAIGIMPMKELSGHVIRIVSMEERLADIRTERNLYFSGLLLAYIALCFIINVIVKVLLKRFYQILSTIRDIQEGNLDARVCQAGSDEMGELGTNINKMLDTIDRLMQENINRELLMKNSEIRALQNQINAHFIYNVLESIKMMAEIDEKYEISDAVTSLGKLLRYGMKWSTKNVTVHQEIDYIKNYLDLINLRFDYRINLAITVPEWVKRQEIPKMSLQPIVENAIYHGIEEVAENASIYIKAFQEGQDYMIEITDSGRGMTQEEVRKLQKKICGEIDVGGGSGNGIGLKNVQDRIVIAFGEGYGISVISRVDCFTKVIVKLPITNSEV